MVVVFFTECPVRRRAPPPLNPQVILTGEVSPDFSEYMDQLMAKKAPWLIFKEDYVFHLKRFGSVLIGNRLAGWIVGQLWWDLFQ